MTYKTAWRMCHEIREYMGTVDGDHALDGFTKQVEFDETYIGGREPEAFGGNVVTEVVSNRRRDTLLPIIKEMALPYTLVHTDEHSAYQTITAEGYYHKRSITHTNNMSPRQVSAPAPTALKAFGLR